MGTIYADVISTSQDVQDPPPPSLPVEKSEPTPPSDSRSTRGTARLGGAGVGSLPGSSSDSSKGGVGGPVNAPNPNPFLRTTRNRPSLPSSTIPPSFAAAPPPEESTTESNEVALEQVHQGRVNENEMGEGTSSGPPPTSQEEEEAPNDSRTRSPPAAPPLSLPLPQANGSSGISESQDPFYIEDQAMASGTSTPLSSPPPNPSTPPAYFLLPAQPSNPLALGLAPPLSLSRPASPKTLTAAQKGKGKASAPVEPRMARARRSTASLGGLAVGMGGMGGVSERKEVEQLVRECRDRMANSSTTDGSSLPPLLLTTLPLNEVLPAPTVYDFNAASTSTSTSTPVSVLDPAAIQAQAQIETPSFRLIDEKAELERRGGSGAGLGRAMRKRGEEEAEETTDAHYNQLHKKYETFEKRQRRREKERLQHERYKMKERVDLIRGMDGKSFAALVASGDAPPADGHVRKVVHPEEIRSKMLEEAEEVLRRYDQLLPVESRMKQKRLDDLADDSGSDATPPPAPPPSFTRTSSSLRPPTLNTVNSHSHSSIKPAPSTSSLSIKLRIPASALASSASLISPAVDSPTAKSPRKGKGPGRLKATKKLKGKGKRKRAEEEEEEEGEEEGLTGDDEEDEEVEEDADVEDESQLQPKSKSKPKPRPSRAKPKPSSSSLLVEQPPLLGPEASATLPPPPIFEPYDEFKYWPRAFGMSLLEKTSMRHWEAVGKEVDGVVDKLEAEEVGEGEGGEMEVDGPAAVEAVVANGVPAAGSSSTSTRPRSSRSSGEGPLTLTLPPALVLDPLPPAPAPLPPPPPPPPAAATEPLPSLPSVANDLPSSSTTQLTLPLPKPKAPRKPPVKTVSALVAGRAPRFNTPWGVKMPDIVGWKNDFDLDGEFWMLMLAEREEKRAGGGGGVEVGEGEGAGGSSTADATGAVRGEDVGGDVVME